jgi:hypothetical protein
VHPAKGEGACAFGGEASRSGLTHAAGIAATSKLLKAGKQFGCIFPF